MVFQIVELMLGRPSKRILGYIWTGGICLACYNSMSWIGDVSPKHHKLKWKEGTTSWHEILFEMMWVNNILEKVFSCKSCSLQFIRAETTKPMSTHDTTANAPYHMYDIL